MLKMVDVKSIPKTKKTIGRKGESKYAEDLIAFSKMPMGTKKRIENGDLKAVSLYSSLKSASRLLKLDNIRFTVRRKDLFAQVLFDR